MLREFCIEYRKGLSSAVDSEVGIIETRIWVQCFESEGLRTQSTGSLFTLQKQDKNNNNNNNKILADDVSYTSATWQLWNGNF